MEHKRILILGASGQIGTALQRALGGTHPGLQKFEVVSLTHEDADLTRPVEIRAAIRGALPHIIINAAAYTAVDRAESEPVQADAINAGAVRMMTEEAAKRNAIFVHYSTDYVFNGRKPTPYTEKDAPDPLSVYGHSKLAGEIAAARYGQHLIFRTSWIYSATHPCFPRTILKAAQTHPTLRVVADQIGAPTPAALVAEVTARILSQIYLNPAFGLYHLSAAGETSWNGFARYILGRAAFAGLEIMAGSKDVAAITTPEYPAAAARPLNSRLDCRKLSQTFGILLPEWRVIADPVLNAIFAEERYAA